jgi:hypothetical protein
MAKRELSKAFEPADTEKRLYDYWLKNHFFHAQDSSDLRLFLLLFRLRM